METNTNPYLIGCANGILDLQGPEGPVFSEGAVDENVTFEMGRCLNMEAIQYIPYETICHNPIYEEINDFFAKLFPDEEVRNYMWRLLASCLKGKNDEEEFYNWVGSGGNGKSKLVELMRITFGDYAGCLPGINKRFIYLEDPTDYNIIDLPIGGKVFLISNTPIQTEDCDHNHVIQFTSGFVSENNPRYNPENNIYYVDTQLDNKLPTWRTYFFSKLVHIYKTEYSTYGLR